jgi:deoxyribonucleoside regulator
MEPSHHELLAAVASMYYVDEMTQNAIAEELGISRVKVYRLLKQARDENVVEIFVNWPLRRDEELEAKLIDVFSLEAALVLQASSQARVSSQAQLGQLAARFLEDRLDAGATLAVCLGGTTHEVIQAIRPNFRVHVNVVQALGSMPSTMGELDSAALARQLADKLGGEVLYLSSPFMAESADDADVLRSQRDIHRTLEAARAADLALLGIGTVDPDRSHLVKTGFVAKDELLDLAEGGVVGDIAGQLFSQDGRSEPAAINDRVIGLSLDNLRTIPTTIAVAMGEQKSAAILGALRSGAVGVLGTDDRTARAVLALNET